jgi:hypothetical protein
MILWKEYLTHVWIMKLMIKKKIQDPLVDLNPTEEIGRSNKIKYQMCIHIYCFLFD